MWRDIYIQRKEHLQHLAAVPVSTKLFEEDLDFASLQQMDGYHL